MILIEHDKILSITERLVAMRLFPDGHWRKQSGLERWKLLRKMQIKDYSLASQCRERSSFSLFWNELMAKTLVEMVLWGLGICFGQNPDFPVMTFENINDK